MKASVYRGLAIIAALGLAAPLVGSALLAAGNGIRHVRHAEIADLLASINKDLPLELQALPSDDEDQWSSWVSYRDSEIRARLGQGDQDTIVTWLLVGSTFTSQPPLDLAELAGLSSGNAQLPPAQAATLRARIDDFVMALTAPGTDPRRAFARQFFDGNGFGVNGQEAIDQLRQHLVDAVQSLALDREIFVERLATAAKAGGVDAEVLMASLFQEKGLSLEAPLAPNYSIERSLAAMKSLELLKPGSVSRIAIVGPGLSFSESDAGFDLYPPQMVQPFAVLDSLRRLQLTPSSGNVEVVVFDISPRVLEHLMRARDQAARGSGYTLNLPLGKDRSWTPAFHDYWMNVGSQVGTSGAPPVPSSAASELRLVSVAPAAVQLVSTLDFNIVTDRLDESGFDLLVVTNVLPYYGRIDQALAVANMESLVKDGGFLLSNTALPAVRTTLRPLRALNVPYTADNQGDRIIWYKKGN